MAVDSWSNVTFAGRVSMAKCNVIAAFAAAAAAATAPRPCPPGPAERLSRRAAAAAWDKELGQSRAMWPVFLHRKQAMAAPVVGM